MADFTPPRYSFLPEVPPKINRYWYNCDNNHGDKKWHRQFFRMLTDFIKYNRVCDGDDNGNYDNKSYK